MTKDRLPGASGLFGWTLLGAVLAACAVAQSGCAPKELADVGAAQGTLMVYEATFDDGTARMEYVLLDDRGERRVTFPRDPGLVSGTAIRVWGAEADGTIVVDRFETLEDAGGAGATTRRDAVIDGTPYPTRTFAFVRVDIGGGLGSMTEAQANIDVFGTGAADGSTKQFMLEGSYGRQDIGGGVVGPLTFVMNGCNYSNLASALRFQVNAALGMTPHHYLWYFGTQNPSCQWAGVAGVGSPSNPASDTWYNASSSCVVLAQEPSHNFGMQHSSSLRCTTAASFANDPTTCTHNEYGDRHDAMGGGCRHFNAWHKAHQGWFGGCNSVRVNSSGTYNLRPFEVECNGIQALQIPMPVTTRVVSRSGGGGQGSNDPVQFYYLELRTRTGFDQSQTSYPTVLVRVGPEIRSRTQTGRHTWILDMNPATTGSNSFDGMSAGQTFTDPAGGVSFTVQSLSASGASIQVTVPTSTANTCLGGGTLTAPGPATCN